MCVIEFYKRGLPHAHIALCLDGEQPDNADVVDKYISAEMPADKDLELYQLVSRFMVHHCCRGKCIVAEHPRCRKRFPKQPCQHTSFTNAGYPLYRRRGTVAEPARDVNVVPYNADLLLKYKSHINVEAAASVHLIAYLYKYIFKGPDLAQLGVRQVDDEIKEFILHRYVSATEAIWRLFGYLINRRSASCTALPVSLPGEEQVAYNADEDVEVAGARAINNPLN